MDNQPIAGIRSFSLRRNRREELHQSEAEHGNVGKTPGGSGMKIVHLVLAAAALSCAVDLRLSGSVYDSAGKPALAGSALRHGLRGFTHQRRPLVDQPGVDLHQVGACRQLGAGIGPAHHAPCADDGEIAAQLAAQ